MTRRSVTTELQVPQFPRVEAHNMHQPLRRKGVERIVERGCNSQEQGWLSLQVTTHSSRLKLRPHLSKAVHLVELIACQQSGIGNGPPKQARMPPATDAPVSYTRSDSCESCGLGSAYPHGLCPGHMVSEARLLRVHSLLSSGA